MIINEVIMLWLSVRQCVGDDEPCNPEDLHALPQKHDVISCLAVSARWITATPLLQVFGGSDSEADDIRMIKLANFRGASVAR